MKVLFNVYPLSLETYDGRLATGVYRVVERLAIGLAEAAAKPGSDLEVTFHATATVWQAKRYFTEHLAKPGARFVAQPWQLEVGGIASRFSHFIHQTLADRRAVMRLLRRGAAISGSRIDRLASGLDRRALAEADIYHSPFVPVPKAVRRERRLPRFTTVFDLIPITHPEFFTPNVIALLRQVLASFEPDDFVTCISHATRETLLTHALQLDPERVFVTHLAAGAQFYPETDPARIATVRAQVGLPPDAPYFLSLCTLEPRKNLEAVIRAFARLKREKSIGPEYRLALVGNMGWKTAKILAALEEANDCRDAILLTGFVPDENLAALYSGATAFVYMSRVEGFGLPPLEAMQCGTPVISSNATSLPEVVGDAGIQLAPDDIDGLGAAMLALATNETHRADLSARSRQRAAKFGWDRFIQQTIDAYRAALSR